MRTHRAHVTDDGLVFFSGFNFWGGFIRLFHFFTSFILPLCVVPFSSLYYFCSTTFASFQGWTQHGWNKDGVLDIPIKLPLCFRLRNLGVEGSVGFSPSFRFTAPSAVDWTNLNAVQVCPCVKSNSMLVYSLRRDGPFLLCGMRSALPTQQKQNKSSLSPQYVCLVVYILRRISAPSPG